LIGHYIINPVDIDPVAAMAARPALGLLAPMKATEFAIDKMRCVTENQVKLLTVSLIDQFFELLDKSFLLGVTAP